MDGSTNLNLGGRVRKMVIPTNRRVWTYAEELELVENALSVKFPGTDLKGDPHINSKIHVWKKQYACLKSMLGVYGIGLNSSTYHIDALPEVWDAYVKIADIMGSIAQRIGSEFEAGKKCGQVYDTLGMIESLTVKTRVKVVEYLCNNSKDMDLFYSLSDDAKKVYVKRIMRKLGCVV
ncbi:hypothetical protein ACS0TY_008148 [Phlomoides rotata]